MTRSNSSLAAVPDWISVGRVPSLDGLRAISILLVIIAHLAPTTNSPISPRYWHFAVLGWLGVPLFFVISGFIITLLLLRERDRTGRVSYRGFITRRALRILPAYVVFLVVLFGLSRAGSVQIPINDWLKALTYTTSIFRVSTWEIGHTWSLSVEEHFYLVWPVILIGTRRAVWVAFGYVLAAPGIRMATARFGGEAAPLDFFTLTRMDSIACGCCLAFLIRHPWPERARFVAAARTRRSLLVAASIVGAIGASWYLQAKNEYYRQFVYHTFNAILLTSLTWLAVACHATRVGRLLNSQPCAVLGSLSYSLYLWQQPFLKQGDAWYCQWPANILLLSAFSLASYLLVESPLLRLKDRLHSKPSGVSCGSPISSRV